MQPEHVGVGVGGSPTWRLGGPHPRPHPVWPASEGAPRGGNSLLPGSPLDHRGGLWRKGALWDFRGTNQKGQLILGTKCLIG